MGIMPTDRNKRLESALRKGGIPSAPGKSENKQDATNSEARRGLRESLPTPDTGSRSDDKKKTR